MNRKLSIYLFIFGGSNVIFPLSTQLGLDECSKVGMNLGKVGHRSVPNSGGGRFQMSRNVGRESISFLWSKDRVPERGHLREVVLVGGIVAFHVT